MPTTNGAPRSRNLVLHQYEMQFDSHVSGILFLERQTSTSTSRRRSNLSVTSTGPQILSAAKTMDFRTYFAFVLLLQLDSRRVPAQIQKAPATLKILGEHSEHAIIVAVVQSICEVFEGQLLYRKLETDQWSTGKTLSEKKIRDFVKSRDPILFCLPAFPCKSSNLDEVASLSPDGGEFEALTTLYTFANAIRHVCPPGCVVEVVSDGHVFFRLCWDRRCHGQ